MRKTIFIAAIMLSGCAAQNKYNACVGGNYNACYSLKKKCHKGNGEACHLVTLLDDDNKRELAGYEPEPSWMERNARALVEGLERQRQIDANNTRARMCIQFGNCAQ